MDKEIKEILLKQLELLQKDSENNSDNAAINSRAMVDIANYFRISRSLTDCNEKVRGAK